MNDRYWEDRDAPGQRDVVDECLRLAARAERSVVSFQQELRRVRVTIDDLMQRLEKAMVPMSRVRETRTPLDAPHPRTMSTLANPETSPSVRGFRRRKPVTGPLARCALTENATPPVDESGNRSSYRSMDARERGMSPKPESGRDPSARARITMRELEGRKPAGPLNGPARLPLPLEVRPFDFEAHRRMREALIPYQLTEQAKRRAQLRAVVARVLAEPAGLKPSDLDDIIRQLFQRDPDGHKPK